MPYRLRSLQQSLNSFSIQVEVTLAKNFFVGFSLQSLVLVNCKIGLTSLNLTIFFLQ